MKYKMMAEDTTVEILSGVPTFTNAADLVNYWIAKNPEMTCTLLAKKISIMVHGNIDNHDRYYEAAMTLKQQALEA